MRIFFGKGRREKGSRGRENGRHVREYQPPIMRHHPVISWVLSLMFIQVMTILDSNVIKF